MKILEGELHEVRYDASDKNKLALKTITQMREEDVAYIDDTQGKNQFYICQIARTLVCVGLYVISSLLLFFFYFIYFC